ncbi:MAG: polymerase primary sigma factor [Solirubrobacteraceae bacterium]|jgi:RNA polymerase sigma factor (sigma-70 family)|nr:polymerase primary sigma factor [Solirubrobacteraceae bacterium]
MSEPGHTQATAPNAAPVAAAQVGEELRAEISRGQLLDRDLARDMGRSVPARSAVGREYIAGLGGRAPLDVEAERRLVLAAKRGDREARGQLVEAFIPLISATARGYRSGHVQRLELLQEGVVGLLRALERFEPERGVPFWGYATWWVRQAMQQLVAELTRPVVLSDRALRHLARLKEAHRDALQQDGREPGRGELATRSGLSLEQVDDLLATERAPRSLEEPADGSGDDVGTFGELLVDPLADSAYEQVLESIEIEQLHALLAGLSDREREVLRARYGLDDAGDELSLRAVGARLGLSAERVRQIESRALGKLAAAL